jgi:hypothetical protein
VGFEDWAQHRTDLDVAKLLIGVSIGEDISTSVTERADRSYSWQILCKGFFGGVGCNPAG